MKPPISNPKNPADQHLNDLFAVIEQARTQGIPLARETIIDLRRVFYERKRALEAIQSEARRSYLQGADYWNAQPGKRVRLSQLSYLCRRIAAVFADLGLGLHERHGVASEGVDVASKADVAQDVQHPPSRQQQQQPRQDDDDRKFPSRMYLGLGE